MIDAEGKEIVPCRYDEMDGFIEGLARVSVYKGYKRCYGFVDKAGNEVVPCKYADAIDFRNGVASVMLGDEWMFIDKDGKKVD